jgi:GT2 family glycosyltransferase
LELLVLDNNSHDGTSEAVRSEYPFVDIRVLNDNYGCTTGRNIGIVELIKKGCAYICTLDNDCFINNPRFFDLMVSAFESNPDVDGYGAIVVRAHNNEVDTMGSRRTWYGIRRAIKTPTANTRVDFLPGGASMIRSTAYMQFGLFDNDYPPVGGQDHAWGIRVTKSGANLHFNPLVEVIHDHPGSQTSRPEKDAFILRGKAMFLKKHPSLIYPLLDLRDCRHYIKEYGIKFVLQHYYRGFSQKTYKNNYKYEEFVKKGLDIYYKENRTGSS